MMANNQKCYSCIYRGDLPGDAHSECHHPAINDHKIVAAAYFITHGGIYFDGKLKVLFARHGVQQGWAFWPMNFDPVWLEECTGHTVKAPPAPQSFTKAMEARPPGLWQLKVKLMGLFYEAYDTDANKLAKTLGFTLTTVPLGPDRGREICGFPAYDLDGVTERLKQAGIELVIIPPETA